MSIDPIKLDHVQVLGGPGPAMVFGHGFGTDQRAWNLVALAFTDTQRVVLFDQAGCRHADPRGSTAQRHGALDGYARDLLEILDATQAHDAIYVDLSISGVTGLLALLMEHCSSRLVLIGASPRFVNDPPDYVGIFAAAQIDGLLDLMERDQMAWSQTFAPVAIGNTAQARLIDRFALGLRASDPLVTRRFGRIVFGVDMRARLGNVEVPSPLLHSTHDSIVPIEVGRYLQRDLRQSTLVEVDCTGLCPHQTQPACAIEHIRHCLQTHVH